MPDYYDHFHATLFFEEGLLWGQNREIEGGLSSRLAYADFQAMKKWPNDKREKWMRDKINSFLPEGASSDDTYEIVSFRLGG